MRCPVCGHDGTRVVDSRPVDSGSSIRRRRSCEACGIRFTTYERVQAVRMVRKRSGRLEPFTAAKLRRGVEAALTDRPVAADTVDRLVETIESELQSESGAVPSDRIGRMVLEKLRVIDEVASVRFASVYKEFQRAGDFERELAELESVNRPE